MQLNKETIKRLCNGLDVLIQKMEVAAQQQAKQIESVAPSYRHSAENLVHYQAFRSFDIRNIQKKLRNFGLTRFANAEGHIMASVKTTRFMLGQLLAEGQQVLPNDHFTIKRGRKLLAKNTKALLGNADKGRRVRIMVTQPTAAAYDYDLVHQMVAQGMNCARINCAHDNPAIWQAIIQNVKKASAALDQPVKIAMDLAGPKIRTGQLPLGPKVKKFKPQKDVRGKVVAPATIYLVPDDITVLAADMLPIKDLSSHSLALGDNLHLVDARGKKRKLQVTQLGEGVVALQASKSIYIETGMQIKPAKQPTAKALVVAELPAVDQFLLIKKGDGIMITKEAENDLGNNQLPAVAQGMHRISCQMPQVFACIKTGERVLFDDGKIAGQITEVHPSYFIAKITMAKDGGAKLKAEKGINFPDTVLGFSGLTQKDKDDLPFVVAHADIVNFSFVNTAADVRQLRQELARLDALGKIAVILKIETQYAFGRLPEILIEAMQQEQIGVMIARGDLAIETGWDNIGMVQNQILSLCGAAHIPVVWATQVLENLAKTGLPSRSEITDAVNALKAEAVMLNKGAYILEAVHLLHTILAKMEPSQNKNEAMLPKLKGAKPRVVG